MSRSRSRPPSSPQAALDALLMGAAGDPVRRALWLDELDLRLRPLLPPSLAAHARLANVDGARLVFVVDSPVWHAKLRLAASGLLDAARSVGLDVTAIVIRTTTQPITPKPGMRSAAMPMSAVAREGLRDALASLRESGEGGPAKDES
jgi:hypothetical protein